MRIYQKSIRNWKIESRVSLDKPRFSMYTKQAITKLVIKFPCSRGDSGALYLQSAPAGVMSHLGSSTAGPPLISGDDVLVLRNRNS